MTNSDYSFARITAHRLFDPDISKTMGKGGVRTMTAIDLLTLVAQVFFALLCLVSIIDFIRHRDIARRDIALMFTSLGVPISVPPLIKLLGIQVPWLSAATTAVLIAHPYIMLRLLRFFRPIPRWIWPASLVVMVVSWPAIIL